MIERKVYGFQHDGRALAPGYAEKIYGSSLEIYVTAGKIHRFSDEDSPTYAHKGLLCDSCLSWVLLPYKTEGTWWLVNPDLEKQGRFLAPCAVFLETLQVDAVNLTDGSL